MKALLSVLIVLSCSIASGQSPFVVKDVNPFLVREVNPFKLEYMESVRPQEDDELSKTMKGIQEELRKLREKNAESSIKAKSDAILAAPQETAPLANYSVRTVQVPKTILETRTRQVPETYTDYEVRQVKVPVQKTRMKTITEQVPKTVYETKTITEPLNTCPPCPPCPCNQPMNFNRSSSSSYCQSSRNGVLSAPVQYRSAPVQTFQIPVQVQQPQMRLVPSNNCPNGVCPAPRTRGIRGTGIRRWFGIRSGPVHQPPGQTMPFHLINGHRRELRAMGITPMQVRMMTPQERLNVHSQIHANNPIL